ncbi:uncharacterized protein VTP21DRAFT_2817 [Calcarisporiella thermophila]|uniref:uncharacterized protein n=1 Tax=Calcarisporiella thermophila TaxID=911321 RepID=UPI0037444164
MFDVIGIYHTYWLVILLPREEILSLIPDGYSLAPINSWPAECQSLVASPEHHPLLLEIGKQHDSGPQLTRWLRADFGEAKVSVPFVLLPARFSTTRPFVYKRNIYLTRRYLAWSSWAFFGLNSEMSSIAMSETNARVKTGQDTAIDADIEEGAPAENMEGMKRMFTGIFVGDGSSYGEFAGDVRLLRSVKGVVRFGKGMGKLEGGEMPARGVEVEYKYVLRGPKPISSLQDSSERAG